MRKSSEAKPNQVLKRQRELRGWSQADVAEKIGGDPKTVGRWERGITSPGPQLSQKLCELFGKNAAELGLIQEDTYESTTWHPQGPIRPQPHPVPLHVAWPLIWNVPYRRNPYFTGREDILKSLHDVLTSARAAALTQPQAISGLGGIGKTQTAVEYAYRYRNDYEVVLLARADTREALISDFVTMAGLLNLPEKEARDQNHTVNAFKRWLEDHSNWLLIFDNADDLEMTSDFIPTMAGGHTLLTTREQVTGAIAQGVELEKMEPEEGTLFLLRRAKLIEPGTLPDNISSGDWTRAKTIVEAMDGLPLALDQAAAYIEETGCGLSDYLSLYQARHTQLLKRRGRQASDHPEPVAATWLLSFERVARANPAAADLLRFCAFLHPDVIPQEIIIEGSSYLGSALGPVASDPLLLDEAIGELRKYSLVRRNAGKKTLNMHRLVQTVLKEEMDEEMQRQWAERVVYALNCAFPKVEYPTWPRCQQYLPQVQVCAALIAHWRIHVPESARLLDRVGSYLKERGQYEQAEPFFQQALSIKEQTLGVEHPATAGSLNRLAELYHAQGKYEQAEALHQRALAIREQILGPDHPSTARSLNNLAEIYYDQGKYEQAEPLYQRALGIREQALGPNDPGTARCLNSLAELYHAQGKYEQAEPLYQRALAIREETLAPEHPYIANTLNNLARLYCAQGRYTLAEPLCQRALAICEDVLGEDHPDTASSLVTLAQLYQAQNQYAQARALCQRALAIQEKVLGRNHPDTAASLNILAELRDTSAHLLS